MSLINSTAIPNGASYELEQSLRFNDNDSAHLSKTFASAGNRKTWSYSFWVKRTELGTGTANRQIFLEGYTSSTSWFVMILNDDALQIYDAQTSQPDYGMATARLFRDTSAWYHVLLAVDTTQSTDTNRVKLYINGINEPLTDQYGLFPLNYQSNVNSAVLHNIGKYTDISTTSDYYLSEVNFIDGLAKAPADFGETGTYGEWKPIEYSGSYGTNGFYLPFKQDYTVEGFSTVLYKGNATAGHYIGGTGFKPDMTWIKGRTVAQNPVMIDAVRGVNKRLLTNFGDGEATDATILLSFDTDGFSLGASSESNNSNDNFVTWNWDMGGSNATLTAGSIDSTVRANPTYGQSIVSYTGNGTASATVAHGLSAKPEMIIIKNRTSSSKNWYVYHEGLHASSPEDYRVLLNTTAAASSNTTGNSLQGTAPTNSLFTLGNGSWINENNSAIIAYCFHSVSGYSKFGSYTGNGSANHAITGLGFEPAFLLIKKSSGVHDWVITDNTRNPNDPLTLLANSSAAETNQNGDDVTSFDADGFKVGTNGRTNGNTETFIYMAFADKREYAYWLDQSGNNNDWTSNNLTESDIMVDSPTNNFSTFNPLDPQGTTSITFSEGNLKIVQAASWTGAVNNFLMTSGKWYWEVYGVDMSNSGTGVIKPFSAMYAAMDTANGGYFGGGDGGYGINFQHGNDLDFFTNTTKTTDQMFSGYNNGDIVQVAYDADTGKIWIGKNNTWGDAGSGIGNPSTGANPAATTTNPDEGYYAGFVLENCTIVANFGQDSSFAGNNTAQGNQDGNDIGDFYYTPPTGFLALCTKNLPDVAVTPSEHFNTVTYTGTGSSNTQNADGITGGVDFLWTKSRSHAKDHILVNDIIGGNTNLSSHTTAAENTASNRSITLADSSFTLNSNSGHLNESGKTYVSWLWKANGSGSSNTNGSITSTVSANVDAGFSIVSYTGTGSNATVAHGLNSAPEMVIVKDRSNANSWQVFHTSLGNTAAAFLDLTAAADTSEASYWNSTSPTSSLINLGTNTKVNHNSHTYIAYAFHSVSGYSKVGSYIGNGNADGTFVYTGFRPAWLMVKNTAATGSWWVVDCKRPGFNGSLNSTGNARLRPNTSGVEDDAGRVDTLSNGFKIRTPAYGESNTNNVTYIYLAFAETPFKYSNAR